MKYRILCIGKIKDSFYRDEIEVVCKRISRNGASVEIMEFPDEKIPDNLKEQNRERFLEKECAKMQQKIGKQDVVIALCIEGKELNTVQHKEWIQNAIERGAESITYVIGGSLGLPEALKKRANLKLSFSQMTFPHQMMRLVLCEELARVTE